MLKLKNWVLFDVTLRRSIGIVRSYGITRNYSTLVAVDAVLRIRCLFHPWIRDPGWVKSQDPDPG
jgi:hypothetical protein